MYNATKDPKAPWIDSKKSVKACRIEDYDVMEIFSPTNDYGLVLDHFDDEDIEAIEKSVRTIMEFAERNGKIPRTM